MSAQGSHKVTFVLWPRRLVTLDKESLRFMVIGWVWLQKADIVRTHRGWVAYLEHQTEEALNVCGRCGRSLKEATCGSSRS